MDIQAQKLTAFEAWQESLEKSLGLPVYLCISSWGFLDYPCTHIFWDDVAKEWYI